MTKKLIDAAQRHYYKQFVPEDDSYPFPYEDMTVVERVGIVFAYAMMTYAKEYQTYGKAFKDEVDTLFMANKQLTYKDVKTYTDKLFHGWLSAGWRNNPVKRPPLPPQDFTRIIGFTGRIRWKWFFMNGVEVKYGDHLGIRGDSVMHDPMGMKPYIMAEETPLVGPCWIVVVEV